MTDAQRKAIKILIERHTAANTATPEIARSSLIREGLYTNEGKIAPEYGGSTKAASNKS